MRKKPPPDPIKDSIILHARHNDHQREQDPKHTKINIIDICLIRMHKKADITAKMAATTSTVSFFTNAMIFSFIYMTPPIKPTCLF